MTHLCLVVADTARARIFTYERLLEPSGAREELVEASDLVNPGRRARGSALYSDAPGSGRVAAHTFGFDDHRDSHRDELVAKFAATIATELERVLVATGYRRLVVIAQARMLGHLRPVLPRRPGLEISEVERDLANRSTAELREHLAALDVLPPRT